MNKIPTHVAIIMDGNGRWATRQNKERTFGHLNGYKTLKKTALHIFNQGVKYLSVFAFSTENFQREKSEVDYLMNLFLTGFEKDTSFFLKHDVKVVFSGTRYPLEDKVWNAMKKLEKETKHCKSGVLNICLNYGGQLEIVDATKKIVKLVLDNKLNIEDINPKTYYNYLYNDLPEVDLMIRTSGELRISNFMLYSISYAELYFTKVCFPDFDSKEFDKALLSYQNRNITKGK